MAGTGLGDVQLQRAWEIVGATTVHGHDAAFRLAVFEDAGWAGESGDFWSGAPLRMGGGL